MNLQNLFQEIQHLTAHTEQVFIYGFGTYGRNFYQILKRNQISVDGFLVSKKTSEMDTYELPVYEASSYLKKNVGFILALNERNATEVKKYLMENKIDMNCVVNAGEYLESFGDKKGMHGGSIEVITVVGCKINCKYCPQSLLLTRYFEQDKKRTSVMSMQTFEHCLDFFPKEYDLAFGGMSEPFLNEKCLEMLRLACDKGKRISLFTTLVGIKPDQVEEILKLPLNFVMLHVADQKDYAHIEKNDEYYEILRKFVNAKKADGTPFVNLCNAQTEPDDKVKEICKGKYEILTEMTDRAGSLDGAELIHNKIKSGKLRCGTVGEDLNNNLLLPDGSVILCCNDYGLQHILGNIYENTFDEIMNSPEKKRVQAGMDGDTGIDILCRNCSLAHACL